MPLTHSNPKAIAIVTDRGSDTIELEVPYNAKLVAQIKYDIPAAQRQWVPGVECTDPDTHHRCSGRWVIQRAYRQVVLEMLNTFYDNVLEQTPHGVYKFRRTR